SIRLALAAAVALPWAALVGGCENWQMAAVEPPGPLAPLPCTDARTGEPIPLGRLSGIGTVAVTFDELRQRVRDRCGRCHLDTRTGGFQYTDAVHGSSDRPGLAEAGDKMAAKMLDGTMPPGDSDPDGTRLLGLHVQAWIAAGMPETSSFAAPAS